MRHKTKAGITIPELIGVFALIGVLGAALIPHLVEMNQANRLSKLRFNLERLRLRIDEYRQRTEEVPPSLGVLFDESDTVFDNPFCSRLDVRNTVKEVQSHPPFHENVTPRGAGGWLYNPATGGVWADSEGLLGE